MRNLPMLTILGALPLAGAVATVALPPRFAKWAKRLALAISLLVLVGVRVLSTQFDPGIGGFQFRERYAWIPQFGISYALGVDGIALVLIALTAMLTPVVMLASWRNVEDGRRGQVFFALLLVIEAMMIGVFAAKDLFLFYVFFEVMLIPMYFLIGSYGGAQRSYAAVKFLLYNLAGGLLMLAAVIGLYVISAQRLGEGTFDVEVLTQAVADGRLAIDSGVAKALFAGFFLAFAIKAPLWPFHTWLPDAASETTPPSAALLVGVLDKAGTFGMLRYCLPLFPVAAKYFAPLIITLCVIGIIYGALLAIGQTDLLRLIAYTSISHFGFIGLGIFAMTSQGQAGATLYMVTHGLSTTALFLIAGFLISRRGSRRIADYGGVAKVAPLLAGIFLLAGLSSLALPGLAPFISEFLVLAGTFIRYPVAAILATLGIILAAVYILLTYQRTMTGPVKPGNERLQDLAPREIWAVAPLVAMLIVLGFYPKPMLELITPAVNTTLGYVHQQAAPFVAGTDVTVDPAGVGGPGFSELEASDLR